MQKSVVLGDEYDDALAQTLMDVLKARGARQLKNVRGLAGSQQLSILEVEIDGEPLIVESETYIGLSIRGEADLVEAITGDVERKRGGATGDGSR